MRPNYLSYAACTDLQRKHNPYTTASVQLISNFNEQGDISIKAMRDSW